MPDELLIELYLLNTVFTRIDAIMLNKKNGINKHMVMPYIRYALSVKISIKDNLLPPAVSYILTLFDRFVKGFSI